MRLSLPSVERVLQAATVVMLVVLAVYLVTYTQTQREAADCQERVNAEFRAALTTRTAAAADERSALRQVLVDALVQPPDPGRARDSLARYLAALDAADTERARTPLPTAAPSCR